MTHQFIRNSQTEVFRYLQVSDYSFGRSQSPYSKHAPNYYNEKSLGDGFKILSRGIEPIISYNNITMYLTSLNFLGLLKSGGKII